MSSRRLPTSVVDVILRRREELLALEAYLRLRSYSISLHFNTVMRAHINNIYTRRPGLEIVAMLRQRLRGLNYPRAISNPLDDFNHWLRYRYRIGAAVVNPYRRIRTRR